LKEQRKLGCAQDFSERQITACDVGYQVCEDVLRSQPFQTALEAEMTILKSTVLVRAAALAAITAALAIAAPVRADDAMPETAGGRYIFNKTADGMIRLDTKSGEVALCSQRTVGWACTAAPEDRAVLEDEIARLRAENAALKKDILARGLPLPPGANPVPSPDQPSAQNKTGQNSITVPLPSDADIDRVTDFANKVWHRFKDMVDRAQQQIFSKS
jgi:hypothetical protein